MSSGLPTKCPRMGWTDCAHAPNDFQSQMGLRSTQGAQARFRTTSTVAVSTIGIDAGSNTLLLIGLDEQEMIVLREKLARGWIGCRLANIPHSVLF